MAFGTGHFCICTAAGLQELPPADRAGNDHFFIQSSVPPLIHSRTLLVSAIAANLVRDKLDERMAYHKQFELFLFLHVTFQNLVLNVRARLFDSKCSVIRVFAEE